MLDTFFNEKGKIGFAKVYDKKSIADRIQQELIDIV